MCYWKITHIFTMLDLKSHDAVCSSVYEICVVTRFIYFSLTFTLCFLFLDVNPKKMRRINLEQC